jgi:hypothetical protein
VRGHLASCKSEIMINEATVEKVRSSEQSIGQVLCEKIIVRNLVNFSDELKGQYTLFAAGVLEQTGRL